MDLKEKKSSELLAKLEIVLNTINHGLIAITTFYLMWYCFRENMFSSRSIHAWMTALGYQLLMAEGIMAFYKGNSLTFLSSRQEKTNIHWILQAVGGSMGLAGCIVEIWAREVAGRKHFNNAHAIYGKIEKII